MTDNLGMFGRSCEAEADLISYNSAISACEAAGEWEHTLALLEAGKLEETNPTNCQYMTVHVA